MSEKSEWDNLTDAQKWERAAEIQNEYNKLLANFYKVNNAFIVNQVTGEKAELTTPTRIELKFEPKGDTKPISFSAPSFTFTATLTPAQAEHFMRLFYSPLYYYIRKRRPLRLN